MHNAQKRGMKVKSRKYKTKQKKTKKKRCTETKRANKRCDIKNKRGLFLSLSLSSMLKKSIIPGSVKVCVVYINYSIRCESYIMQVNVVYCMNIEYIEYYIDVWIRNEFFSSEGVIIHTPPQIRMNSDVQH